MTTKTPSFRHFLASLALCALAAPALAGGTSHWTHSTEADFKKGKFNNVVATNLGDLKLSRAIKTLLEQDPRVSAVYALAEDKDGAIYAATGPQGIVLRLKGEKVSTLATLEEENVFSLLVDREGKLLIGTGGEKGRILRLDLGQPDAKPVEFFSADGVQYVWKIVQTDDGNLYAATGPNGQLFEIKPDGSKSVLFDSDENNILSLISDGGDTLYAGTDPNGLVYRIRRTAKEAFVVFDANEAEVGALAMDQHGNLYAATGQAAEGAEGGPDQEGATERSGRPDSADRPATLPSPKPTDPQPPPGANPGDPNRIPTGRTNLIMLDSLGSLLSDDGADDPIGNAPGDRPPAVPPQRRTPARTPPAIKSLPPGLGRLPGSASPGNAIYRIDPKGFVTEIFRQPGMVLSLLERDGILIVGTGSEGLVYQVDPQAEETVVLAKVDPKQVTSLLAGKDGRIILGLSNVGGLASMSSGFAKEGTYTSPVLDAGQISRFGKMHLQGLLPEGAGLTVSTRSGNLQEPGDASWSKWSPPAPAVEYLQIASPTARFFQYRLNFASQDGATTPVVEEVDVAHQVPNLAPQIKAVRITPAPEMEGGRGGAMGMGLRMPPPMLPPGDPNKPPTSGRLRIITWDASDPNNDDLEYALYLRRGPTGPWILMEDKIKEPQFLWDTRTAADGRYQIKVATSDIKANALGEGKEALRVSDPVVVDNTPPVIGDLKCTPLPQGVKIQARVVDRTSTVTAVEYSTDSKDDWQAVRASDNIFDSPEEGAMFTVDGLSPGNHQVMVRATDAHGNQSYEAVRVVIGPGQ